MKKTLRRMAVLGPLLILAIDLQRDLPWQPRQEYALVVLALTVLATGVTLRWSLRGETRRIREHLDLLVPLGLYVFAEQLLAWVVLVPFVGRIMEPGWDVNILALSFTLSVNLVVVIVLSVMHAAWTLALVCQATEGRPVDLMEGLDQVRRRFWRVFGCMAVSLVVFFLGVALVIAACKTALTPGLFLIGLGTVALNFVTAGLLLRAVSRPELPFWTGFREGLAVSWRHQRRWWVPLLVQMEIVGLITYVTLSFSYDGGYSRVANWAVRSMPPRRSGSRPRSTSRRSSSRPCRRTRRPGPR